MKKLLLTFVLTFFLLISCKENYTGNDSNFAKSSPTASPDKAEIERKNKEEEIERQKAVESFVSKNYKGWILKGTANEYSDCEESDSNPCDLLLEKGEEQKVVPVMIKRFTNANGESRLVVFEARPVDLTLAKIRRIKEIAAEDARELYRDEISD